MNDSDSHDYIDALIARVRIARQCGATFEQVIETIEHEPRGEVILAWHAAMILDGEKESV